jgi:hypothetical protein
LEFVLARRGQSPDRKLGNGVSEVSTRRLSMTKALKNSELRVSLHYQVRIFFGQPVIEYLILLVFAGSLFSRVFSGVTGLAFEAIRGRDGFTRDFGRGRHENLSGAICVSAIGALAKRYKRPTS